MDAWAAAEQEASSRERRAGRSRRRLVATLLALVALAALVRAFGARHPHPIHRDALQYMACARAAAAGDWRHLAANDYTPGYPVLSALGFRILGGRIEKPPVWIPAKHRFEVASYPQDRELVRAGLLVSLAAGTLSVLPVFAFGALIGGEAAGLWAATAAALQPYAALYAGFVLTEASFFFFLLSSFALAAWLFEAERTRAVLVRAALLGLVGAAAFSVRPEVLAVLLPAALFVALRRWRLQAWLAMVAPAVLVLAPFLRIYYREPNRAQHAIGITPKRPLGWFFERLATEPFEIATRLVGNLGQLIEYGHPLFVVLAVAGLVIAWKTGAWRRRRLVLFTVCCAALYLGVISTVRVDHRLALGPALLLLPMVGVALEQVQRRLGGSAKRSGAVLALVLVAVTLPILAHKSRAQKPHLLEAARKTQAEIARLGGERPAMLVHEPRLAYYAGARLVALEGLDHVVSVEEARRAIDRGEIRWLGLTVGKEPGIERFRRLVPQKRFVPLGRFDPPPGTRFKPYALYRVEPRAP